VIELDRDPITGKRRQKWHSGYRTRREAERARIQLLAALDAGTYVEPRRQRLQAYIDEWLAAIQPTIREATFYSYKRNLRLHVLPYIGSTLITKIDAGILNGLYALLRADGRSDGTGGLSPRTIHYIHTILHRALRDAVRWGRLARNPVDAADPPRHSNKNTHEPATWDAEILQRFLEHSRSSKDRYYPAWVFLATTGARRGEALGIRWSDLDFDNQRTGIRQTVIAVQHEIRFSTPKTTTGRRSIALDPSTVAVLRTWRRQQAQERLALGPGYQDHDLVFAKPDGRPLHPERFSREFDRRVKRWRLPRITLHGLRHTWATLALASGIPSKIVAERLGHSSTRITDDIYAHVTPTMQTEAARLIAAKVFGIPTTG
jgi:integrase